MNEPLISVIVPVYNVEKYLPKCIRSIVNQTYKNLEIILVDDGSLDSSSAICDSLAKTDERITAIHKKNGGQSSARNAGLNICKGSYIGFVDSDDYIEPDMYESLMNTVGCNKRTIALTGIAVEDEGGNVLREDNLNLNDESKEQYIESLLLHKGDVSACSKLFHKDIIGKCRFDESKLNEDLLFIFEIEKNFDTLVFTKKIGYHYISHQGSTSRSFGKAIHDMVDNAKEIRKYVRVNYPQLNEQAERLEIYQNLAFLWSVPDQYNREIDPMCKTVLRFIRDNIIAGFKNHFLSGKDKIRLAAVALLPQVAPRIYRLKKTREMRL